MNARQTALQLLAKERCESIPALKQFVDAVEVVMNGDYRAHFFECEPAFRSLLRSGFLGDLVNHELKKYVADPLYVPILSFESQVIIAETDAFQLSVGLINRRTAPKSDRIQGVSSHTMLGVIGQYPLSIMVYKQSDPMPEDLLEPARLLVRGGEHDYFGDDILVTRAGYDVIEMLPKRGETSVVVNFSSKFVMDYIWEYDKRTLAPVRLVPADVTLSRIEYATQILAHLGDQRDLEVLRELANHPAHFIRWSAVRAAARIDSSAGMRLLESAASDKHPHVRKAANLTLDRLHAQHTPAIA